MEVITTESVAFRTILRKIDAIYNLLDVEMKEKENGQFIDNNTVCCFLKISRSTLQRLRKSGKIKYYQDRRKILYHKTDVMKYIGKFRRNSEIAE